MSSWRLSALPAAGRANAKLGSALLPIPAKDAGAWQQRGIVRGSPGTTRIPAPAPFPYTDMSLAAQANAGFIGEPSSKFDAWCPSVYYTYPVSKSPVSVFSDNQMPVPAIDPRGLPGVVMPGPIMLGQTQVANPVVAPKYLDIKQVRRRR